MKNTKLTPETKCWMCGRSSKELAKTVETYWKSGKLGEDMELDACFEIIDITTYNFKEKIHVPVCIICSKSLLQYTLTYLRDKLKIDVSLDKPKVSINL